MGYDELMQAIASLQEDIDHCLTPIITYGGNLERVAEGIMSVAGNTSQSCQEAGRYTFHASSALAAVSDSLMALKNSCVQFQNEIRR